MKKALLILLLICPILVFAQKETPKMPIDPATGKINYSEVVKVDSSTSKQELYSRGREWFAKAYNSSNNVLQMDDKDNGKLVGKALIKVYHKFLGEHPSGYINYTIALYLKDGRYKYEITNFHHTGQIVSAKSTIPDYGPCEGMINTQKAMYQGVFNYYLVQTDKDITALIADLKAFMAKPSQGTVKSDW